MRHQIGAWKIDIPSDIEVYQGEMLPHSHYGERFKREADEKEKALLLEQVAAATKPGSGHGQQHNFHPPDTRLCNPHDLIFIQSRAEMNFDLVDEYAEMMDKGVSFDACEGIESEDGDIYIYDGFHRGEAAKANGSMLLVKLTSGTKEEAEWKAFGANIKHGLRRTRRDIERVVKNALKHPNGVRLSNREIARHCGCDDKTVGKYRAELEASAEIPQLQTRDVKRGNQQYQIEIPTIEKYASILELEGLLPRNGTRDEQIEFFQNIKQGTVTGKEYLAMIEEHLRDQKINYKKSDLKQAINNTFDHLLQVHCAGQFCTFNGYRKEFTEIDGKLYCPQCAAKRQQEQNIPAGFRAQTEDAIDQAQAELEQLNEEAAESESEQPHPTAIAATAAELEQILAEEWFFVKNDRNAAIASLQSIKDRTPAGQHVLSNIYNQLKDAGRILAGQKHDIRQACWNLLERLQMQTETPPAVCADCGKSGKKLWEQKDGTWICETCGMNRSFPKYCPHCGQEHLFNQRDLDADHYFQCEQCKNFTCPSKMLWEKPEQLQTEATTAKDDTETPAAQKFEIGHCYRTEFGTGLVKGALEDGLILVELNNASVGGWTMKELNPADIYEETHLKLQCESCGRLLPTGKRLSELREVGFLCEECRQEVIFEETNVTTEGSYHSTAGIMVSCAGESGQTTYITIKDRAVFDALNLVINIETEKVATKSLEYGKNYIIFQYWKPVSAEPAEQEESNGAPATPTPIIDVTEKADESQFCIDCGNLANHCDAETEFWYCDEHWEKHLKIQELSDEEITQSLITFLKNIYTDIEERAEKAFSERILITNAYKKAEAAGILCYPKHISEAFLHIYREHRKVAEEESESPDPNDNEPPTVKELCAACEHHRARSNRKYKGKLLGQYYHGKCIRDGGICDPVKALMQAQEIAAEPPFMPESVMQMALENISARDYILHLKMQGLAVRSIARKLKEVGVHNDNGKPWSKSAIDRIIQQARKEGIEV